MKANDSNTTIVSILMLLHTSFGRFNQYVHTVPREVSSHHQAPLADQIFQLPSSPTTKRLRPRKRNLRTDKLLKRLGKAFDADWMSIEQPVHLHEIVSDKMDTKLVSQARQVNFTFVRSGFKKHPNVTSEMVAIFQDWLIQRGSCPVHFFWEDLGINFWPRWIKRGFCVDEESCSWPSGMHCLPAESRRIRLLRWQCVPRYRDNFKKMYKDNKDDPEINATENLLKKSKKRKRRYGMRCKWMKTPYPITDECYCSC